MQKPYTARFKTAIFFPALLAAACFLITTTSCQSSRMNNTTPISETVQNWSNNEIALLGTLWIGNIDSLRKQNSNHVADNPDAIKLGHHIFFDTRFSANGEISCANCHEPEKFFTDGKKTATGISQTTRNTPTVVGAVFNTWFFLDGRADSLWSQALGPLENEKEHGGNRLQFANIIYHDSRLRTLYEKLFGPMPELDNRTRFPKHAGPVANKPVKHTWNKMKTEDKQAITSIFVNIGKALDAYQRQLIPGASRFDKYYEAIIKNDTSQLSSSLTAMEVAGLKLFIGKANCAICHNGPLFTDFSFHNISVPPLSKKIADWGRYHGVHKLLKSEFNCRGKYNDSAEKSCQELKYIVKDKEHTAGAFKTPSLRNVSKTAPYMHAGQYPTLQEVLKHYNDPPGTRVGQTDLKLDIDLTSSELKQLEAFLLALNSPISAPKELLNSPD